MTAAALLLAACTAAPPPPGGVFRRAVPIYSNATFDIARMAGRWHQSAAFAAPAAAPCTGGIAVDGTLSATGTLCLNGQVLPVAGRFMAAGPGRVRLAGADGTPAQDWWMLWVDADYRTLAIGTPSGDWGMVLNRGGPVPPDRLAAARELFGFNGYDLTRLVTLPQDGCLHPSCGNSSDASP